MEYSLVAIYDIYKDAYLMCKRRKDPYKGLLNFVGGKKEDGESISECTMREVYEETGIFIPKNSDYFCHLFTTEVDSKLNDIFGSSISVYLYAPVGGERNSLSVCRVFNDIEGFNKDNVDENDLYWISDREDFSDISKFAGDGNLLYITNIVKKIALDFFMGYKTMI